MAAAGASRAAPLPFTGSLSILIGPFGVGIAGRGVAEVGAYGHLDSVAIPAGAFATQGLVVPITGEGAAPISGIQATAQNGAGSFANPGGGTMALLGSAKVCLYGPCSGAVANLVVPLEVVGQGGTTTVAGPVNLTVAGAPWTVGTARVGTATAMGFAYGPGSQTSSTARASGVIQLVTPIRITTNLPGDFAVVPAFGVLTLHFVPEPGTLALLAAGLALLARGSRLV
jgi:hypothetical protein